jgi:GTP cyclohydrolase IB
LTCCQALVLRQPRFLLISSQLQSPMSSTFSSKSSSVSHALPDIQATADQRNVPINRVGVKGVRYPITLLLPDRENGSMTTVATINMYVALPAEEKGTHMSRFLEVLNEYHDSLSSTRLKEVCTSMKERLKAQEAHLELHFPYFIDKTAPVTGQPGKLDIDVSFEMTSNGIDDFILGITIPATSLCPCSKEISSYGAHNQRCEMTVRVRLREGELLWIEELFEMIEKCASTQVFSVLKRPDEKWVTERAYENPKFVEDIVRDMAIVLNNDERIVWYECYSENYESIHNHNAYAYVIRDKRSS